MPSQSEDKLYTAVGSLKMMRVSDDASGHSLDVTRPDSFRGEKLFGRYVLVRVLGRGGMGVVWLARDEELEREVALKFMPEMIVHDRALLNELKRETKRSLELTHKNIVRIHDFVNNETVACISMEYVDGDTLSNLRADKAQQVFQPNEIASWTTQLCDALDYAHQQARIVHRDLKPSNLMVNQRGDLKISDFGIARSLGDTASRLTIGSGTSGTLVYMSPQQLDGERGTPLDDIYSLGATLYDLLASKPPFYSGNIDRQVRERTAPSMSERRKDLNIEPASLPPIWEQVVARCLEKDPTKRPQSAAEVARELQLASPSVHQHRSISIPRANKRMITLLGLAVLAMAVVAAVVWQMRGQAEMKAEIAKLRQGVMAYPETESQIRGSQSGQQPAALQEEVYIALGKQLGVDPKTLREKLPRLAEDLGRAPNASLYERANANYVARHYSEAERLALEAKEEATNFQRPPNAKSSLQCLELAGLSAHRGIQYVRAMEHFREAEKFVDVNRDSEEWAKLQDAIADLLFSQGKYAEAEKLFRTVVEVRSRVLGPEHPDTLDSRHRLIYALTEQSKHAEAETEARQVLKLREKVLGLEHPDTLASRYNLANTLVHEGKYSEAEALYREVGRVSEKVLGPEHPRTIAARDGLANVLDYQGKNAEAQALYHEVIGLDKKVFGPEHPITLNDRMNLASSLQLDGQLPAAEAEYRNIIQLQEKVLGAEHPDTLNTRNNFAEILDDEKKFTDAEAECRQLIPLETKVLGPKHRTTLNSRGNLALAWIDQGKFADAKGECTAVLTLMEQALGIDHPDTLDYTSKFVAALARQNQGTEALTLAKQMEERARKTLGAENPATQKYAALIKALDSN